MSLEQKAWYAIHTRSRHEKVVAEEISKRGIECFLPLAERLSQWKDRRKLVQFPLFPGYLFVLTCIQESRLDILKVPSVVRIVGYLNQPEPIPESQIKAVKELVFHKMDCGPFPYLVAGNRVRIVRGPLRGLEGTLVKQKKRTTFVLRVDLIQQAVACEIDVINLEEIR